MKTIEERMRLADLRYGPFASTHEALGVALEEWCEFSAAVRSNDLRQIQREALDLAAVLIRLHNQINTNPKLKRRSTK